MKEKERADRFICEVDNLLNEAGRSDNNPQDSEFRQTLHTARTLVATDFSSDSKIRDSLRHRLVHRISAQEKWNHKKEFSMRITFLKRHPFLAVAMALLMAFFTVALVSPGVVTAAAQEIAQFINELKLGDFTFIYQTEPGEAKEQPQSSSLDKPEIEYRDDLWILRTSIGNFGGDPLPGRKNKILSYNTFADVQENAFFPLLNPVNLPDGYVFREGMVTPMDWIFLFYEGPQGDLILAQMPVYSHIESQSKNMATAQTVAVGMITSDPIDETLVNGIPAGWIEGTGLMWESGGISFMLGCANLNLEETILIAESLE
jgi:hypothetical protein